MAKIIGIDLGTTYSAVSVWDEKKQTTVIIPNLEGLYTTPSVVSINKKDEVLVGHAAKRNFAAAPDDTISQIKRRMGEDYEITMGGQVYNPQTISAFILRYLKMCAEQHLGEPVYDAVITVPAYFTEVQKSATRDAGRIAGFNVHRLINEPTAAAIAYGVSKAEKGAEKVYAVYDLGGGTFDVSIIEITTDDITVVGTGGDPHLGGLDMDEAVMKWALREIKTQEGVDLSNDEAAKRRLIVEAEGIKKALVVAENASLTVPYLTVIDGKPLNVDLQISRARFEMLIAPLLKRSLRCLEEAVASAKEKNQRDWEDLDGVLLVGGPTRLNKIRELLRETLKEHRPDAELEIRSDMNPDEVVAMGAAIVAASLKPIGRPPEEIEDLPPEQVDEIKGQAEGVTAAPEVNIYDVTGHSLGIAIQGHKFHKIIEKETVIPVSMTQSGFTNGSDYTTELLVEVYQGEEEFVAANTRIGEVRIDGLEPLPANQQFLEITFTLDVSGTLSTICTDLRTRRMYQGSFTFDGITRMSADEIKAKRAQVMTKMSAMAPGNGPTPPIGQPTVQDGGTVAPVAVPELSLEQIPQDWRDYWLEGKELLPTLEPNKKAALATAMADFAKAVLGGDSAAIEDKAYTLQDRLLDVQV